MFSAANQVLSSYPEEKYTFTGGGFITALELYYLLQQVRQTHQQVRVSVYEKNQTLSETTTLNNAPSLTFNEIVSVVPRGNTLIDKLKSRFDQPGGIRVDDVPGVNNTLTDRKFQSSVLAYSADEAVYQTGVKSLLEAGKESMKLWQEIYETADDELRDILEKSNYNPCLETDGNTLHQGYRIDPIFNVENGMRTAVEMCDEYLQLGARHTRVLTPQEVEQIDPYLADFCKAHADKKADGELAWKSDAAAVWRPGGCLDTLTFLPLFFQYLQKQFGKYTNDNNQIKDCLTFKYDRRVDEVVYAHNPMRITALHFFNSKHHGAYKSNAKKYLKSKYVFCPGEAVGTLHSLGFNEPDYAGFAGPSLILRIPLNEKQRAEYGNLNHCMEVQQEGVVLAWQARMKGDCLEIAAAGTKAYYSDKKPHNSHEFALNRHVLQLNIVNNMLPRLVSIALERDTTGENLGLKDLTDLEDRGIAVCWVGVRAVFFDGMPGLGRLYAGKFAVENARTTTGAGSGGVSFAPVLVKASRRVDDPEVKPDTLQEKLLEICDTRRTVRR